MSDFPNYQVTFDPYKRTCEIIGCVGTATYISKTTRIDRQGYMETIAEMRVCDDHREMQERRYNT